MPKITTLDDLEKTPHAEVFDHGSPRTVRLQLEAGQHIPLHQHPGTTIVLYLLASETELSLDDDTYSLASGDLIRFSGERAISPHAGEDSTAIVVFAPVEE